MSVRTGLVRDDHSALVNDQQSRILTSDTTPVIRNMMEFSSRLAVQSCGIRESGFEIPTPTCDACWTSLPRRLDGTASTAYRTSNPQLALPTPSVRAGSTIRKSR
jgi:hypothetical protein